MLLVITCSAKFNHCILLAYRFGPISSSGVAHFTDTGRFITLQGSTSVIGRALLLQVGTSKLRQALIFVDIDYLVTSFL